MTAPGRPVRRGRPNFGVEEPSRVMLLVAVVLALLFIGVFVGSAVGVGWLVALWLVALVVATVAAARIGSSIWGRPTVWGRALDGVGLLGDEHVLDARCGRGLVAVELAARLPRGRVTATDRWAPGEVPAARAVLELNAELTGVADRVVVDERGLGHDGDSYPVVAADVGRFAAGRAVVAAAARRVAPGGTLVVVGRGDPGGTAAQLGDLGLTVDVWPRQWDTYPPARVLIARRSG